MRITLQDIAECANVNKSTVSRALKNDPRISKTVRSSIMALAKDMGYVPDPLLSELASRQWDSRKKRYESTLAFISTRTISEIVQTTRFLGAKPRAEALGYKLEAFSLQDYSSSSRKRASAVLYNRGYRGLIIGPILQRDWKIDVEWDRFSAVACGLGYMAAPLHRVDEDISHAMGLAWKKLTEAGCHRIGFVDLRDEMIEEDVYPIATFEYKQAHMASESKRIPVLITCFRNKEPFLEWLGQYRPDAVIGYNDMVYWWMKDAGVHIPEDIAFVSLIKTKNDPETAGVSNCHVEVGRAAVDLLDLQIHRHEKGIPDPRHIVRVQGSWMGGASLPEDKVGSLITS